jgi:N-acylglucosamine 2-epimerase
MNRYETELIESIVPFWSNNCIDRTYGGYYSLLDRFGDTYGTEKYMWMQWRIVYMFATIYMTRYSQPDWLDKAVNGFDFLTKHGKNTRGEYYFALNRQGAPLMDTYAAYTLFSDSFAALGSAALYRALKDDKYKQEAICSFSAYKKNIIKSAEQSLAGETPKVYLGHYMILVNLAHTLNECFGVEDYTDEIEQAIEKVFLFWNEDLQLMFEEINVDGSFNIKSCDGRLINPGHALESMWFIMQYAEKIDNTHFVKKACSLTMKILEYGWDDKYGGIYYFKDAIGAPLLEPRSCLKIWWTHNEAAIAALYAYKLTRETMFFDWFSKIDAWSWLHFRDPEYGEWFAYVDRSGKPCHTFKGSNWKTFFHLPRYLLSCIQLLDTIRMIRD